MNSVACSCLHVLAPEADARLLQGGKVAPGLLYGGEPVLK